MNAHRRAGRALAATTVLAMAVAACGSRAPSGPVPSDLANPSPAASLPKVGGTWSAGPALPTSRGEVAVAVLHGRLYVAGGFAQGQGVQSAAFEAFDPTTGS